MKTRHSLSQTFTEQNRSRDTRILIACDDDVVAVQLRRSLASSHLLSDRVTNIQAAWERLRAENFRIAFVAAILPDGPWRLLYDSAASQGLEVPFIVMARSFDIDDWAEAFRHGAFDVLDILSEIPKAAEIASEALMATGAALSRAASNPSNS